MPSGLTCNIYEGKDLSLRGFALKCVTQLGGGYQASHGGERELPKDKAPVIELSNYHEVKLKEAKEELKYWLDVEKDPDKVDKLYNEYIESQKSYDLNRTRELSELRSRYLLVKSKVDSWDAPEEYSSLKKLMLDQINSSMEHDCISLKYLDDPVRNLPTKEDWLTDKLASAARDIDYYTREHAKEVAHNKELNDYIQGLYDELDKVDPYVKKSTKKSK